MNKPLNKATFITEKIILGMFIISDYSISIYIWYINIDL